MKQYESLWRSFIRPTRQLYTLNDMGANRQVFGEYLCEREDFSVISEKTGLKMQCSIFEPYKRAEFMLNDSQGMRKNTRFPCVVYCHANSGCRIDSLAYVGTFIAKGIAVCCFDFTGSGLSEGEYVTLGFQEQHDLATVVTHLRKNKKITAIALHGRSMGAVTCLLYAEKDSSLAGIVVDSPFSNLSELAVELARTKISLPDFLLEACVKIVSSSVEERAGFRLDHIDVVRVVPNLTMPALFIASPEDSFVRIEHSVKLQRLYKGDSSLRATTGSHNAERSSLDKEYIAEFLAVHCEKTVKSQQTSIKNSHFQSLRNSLNNLSSTSENQNPSIFHLNLFNRSRLDKLNLLDKRSSSLQLSTDSHHHRLHESKSPSKQLSPKQQRGHYSKSQFDVQNYFMPTENSTKQQKFQQQESLRASTILSINDEFDDASKPLENKCGRAAAFSSRPTQADKEIIPFIQPRQQSQTEEFNNNFNKDTSSAANTHNHFDIFYSKNTSEKFSKQPHSLCAQSPSTLPTKEYPPVARIDLLDLNFSDVYKRGDNHQKHFAPTNYLNLSRCDAHDHLTSVTTLSKPATFVYDLPRWTKAQVSASQPVSKRTQSTDLAAVKHYYQKQLPQPQCNPTNTNISIDSPSLENSALIQQPVNQQITAPSSWVFHLNTLQSSSEIHSKEQQRKFSEFRDSASSKLPPSSKFISDRFHSENLINFSSSDRNIDIRSSFTDTAQQRSLQSIFIKNKQQQQQQQQIHNLIEQPQISSSQSIILPSSQIQVATVTSFNDQIPSPQSTTGQQFNQNSSASAKQVRTPIHRPNLSQGSFKAITPSESTKIAKLSTLITIPTSNQIELRSSQVVSPFIFETPSKFPACPSRIAYSATLTPPINLHTSLRQSNILPSSTSQQISPYQLHNKDSSLYQISKNSSKPPLSSSSVERPLLQFHVSSQQQESITKQFNSNALNNNRLPISSFPATSSFTTSIMQMQQSPSIQKKVMQQQTSAKYPQTIRLELQNKQETSFDIISSSSKRKCEKSKNILPQQLRSYVLSDNNKRLPETPSFLKQFSNAINLSSQ